MEIISPWFGLFFANVGNNARGNNARGNYARGKYARGKNARGKNAIIWKVGKNARQIF